MPWSKEYTDKIAGKKHKHKHTNSWQKHHVDGNKRRTENPACTKSSLHTRVRWMATLEVCQPFANKLLLQVLAPKKSKSEHNSPVSLHDTASTQKVMNIKN